MRSRAWIPVFALLFAAALLTAAGLALRSWWQPLATTAAGDRQVSLPVVFRTPGGLLEVASIATTELFERKSMLSIAGLNLGTTVSQIRVPATYRYRIELAPEWHAVVRDGRFLVVAPAVKPSLPVAFDTGAMQMQTQAGWARLDGAENLSALLRDVSSELARKAASPPYVEAQREQARKTVTEFVVKWLIRQERWKSVRPEQVKVYFADEPIERLRTFGPEFGASM